METKLRPDKVSFAEVGLVYWLLCAIAGFMWSCPIVEISNTDFGARDLFLGSIIGIAMGALILPWTCGRKISEKTVFILGFVTLILAVPGFMLLNDLLRDVPQFKYDPWNLLRVWFGIAVYSVVLYGVILVPLAALTVYSLWRWLEFRNRYC